ncbi:hypothetical protein K8R42_03285, partial [bacterium]|nr:hypothetical protein [bacterium]
MSEIDIKRKILDKLNKKGSVKVSDIVKETGFSRVYVNKFFRELREENKIILIGRANRAHYVPADKDSLLQAKKTINTFRSKIKNVDLSEDTILDKVRRSTGIFIDLKENI